MEESGAVRDGGFSMLWCSRLKSAGKAAAHGVVVLAGGGVGGVVPFFLRGAFGMGGGAAELIGGKEADVRSDVVAQAYFCGVGEGVVGVMPFDGGGVVTFWCAKKVIVFSAFEAAGDDANVGSEEEMGVFRETKGVTQPRHEDEVGYLVALGVTIIRIR